MKKFRGIGIVLVMTSLVFGLVGCISAPPEQAVTSVESGTNKETTASKEGGVDQVTVPENVASTEEKEGMQLVVKPAKGEFAPTDEVKQLITGDITTLGFNYVYAKDETDPSVDEAISAGHFYGALSEDAPAITLKEKEFVMGDTLSLANNKSLKVDVSKLKSGSVVKIISNKGVVEEKKVMGSEYSKRVVLDQEGLYFVEVWSGDGQLLAVTNPMYVTP